MIDYLKVGSKITVVCIALLGCHRHNAPESSQLENYIKLIRHSELRLKLPSDLVGAIETSQEYQSRYNVVYADEKHISFRAEEYARSGCLIGSNKISVGTIDRKNGCRVYLSHFISPDQMPQLTKVLHSKILKRVKGNGVFLGNVLPTENFCVVKDGLKFVYNEFELMSHAIGVVEVVIPFDEIGKKK